MKRLEVKCPCCGERLEIDRDSGRILQRLGKEDKPADLGKAVQRTAERRSETQSSFDAALEAERHRKEELDALFRKAARTATDSPSSPPSDPDRWR